MATRKTTDSEDEYFAKLEKQKKDELRAKLEAEEKSKAGATRAKAMNGTMKCPKCDTRLATVAYKGVEIDRCESCRGIFLDDGELEMLAGAPSSGGFFRGFLKSLKKGT